MWIKFVVLLCCVIATCVASSDRKRKDETRGKRNLEYSIAHHYPVGPNYRIERRISTGPQLPAYPPFFPGPKQYAPVRKGRPHSIPPPPYAVQMEPLVHYSQRDPLYDFKNLPVIPDDHNDLIKPDDLLTDNNNINEHVYGPHLPPTKQYVERPFILKEPEPIIEIIIKESNATLPPVPSPPITPAPRKKEQVQVFYVKYKKNPLGHGKDAIIYEKPVPAISPIADEPAEEPENKQVYASSEYVTVPPLPSTTLRTIIRPESETYHSNSGIHVTFDSQREESYKKPAYDDDNEESAPEPAISSPHDKSAQTSFFQTRFPYQVSSQNYQHGGNSFRTETQRPLQQLRAYNPRTQIKQQHDYNRQYPQPQFPPQPFPNRPPAHFQNQPGPAQFPNQPFPPKPASPQFSSQHFSQKPPPSQFSHQQFPPQFPNQPFLQKQPSQQFQQLPSAQHGAPFNPPRQPVPYKPFDQLQPQIQFPRPQTHFPIRQQPPQVDQRQIFNSQPNNLQTPQIQRQNIFNPHIAKLQQPTQANNVQNQEALRHHQIGQQQLHSGQRFTQQDPHNEPRIIPPGGELIPSVSKYEQHISIPNEQTEPQALPLQQPIQPFNRQQFTPNQQQNQISQQTQPFSQQQFNQQQLTSHLSQDEYRKQIQQQFVQSYEQQQRPQFEDEQQKYFSQLQQNPNQPFYQTTSRPVTYSTTPKDTYSTTQTITTTNKLPEIKAEKPPKALNIQLPDEVPDELREQLLSSGILDNADISVLDYDKVGDIPLSALPPEQLANFYGAGGAQQLSLAGSHQVMSVVKQDGTPIQSKDTVEQEMEGAESYAEEVAVAAPVQMKVVRYDPQTPEGQEIQNSYLKDGATQVEPVVVNDQKYNRYLPLKVNGAQFPIPDVPELRGKNITSVVVLAPVDYNFEEGRRTTREVEGSINDVRLLAGQALKELIRNPTLDNYKKWLERENNTETDKQSVILLVTGVPGNDTEKEIFMYDVATQTVSKLAGELSTAFVDAAETNASEEDIDALAPSSSNVVETRVPYPGDSSVNRQDFTNSEDILSGSASDFVENTIPIIDPMQPDLDAEGSEQLESFVDVSGMQIHPHDDLSVADSNTVNAIENHVYISSGYSKTGSNI